MDRRLVPAIGLRIVIIAGLVVFAVYLGLWIALIVNDGSKSADYTAFMTGWTIVLDGRGHDLYDVPTQIEVQRRLLGGLSFEAGLNPFNNPPHLVLPFVPLALLPLLPSYLVWGVIQLGPPDLARLAAPHPGRDRLATRRTRADGRGAARDAAARHHVLPGRAVPARHGRDARGVHRPARRPRSSGRVLVGGRVAQAAGRRRDRGCRPWWSSLAGRGLGSRAARGRRAPRDGRDGRRDLAGVRALPGRLRGLVRRAERPAGGHVEPARNRSRCWSGRTRAAAQADAINTIALVVWIAGLVGIAIWWARRDWDPASPRFQLGFALTLVLGMLLSPHLNPHDGLLLVPAGALAYGVIRSERFGPCLRCAARRGAVPDPR